MIAFHSWRNNVVIAFGNLSSFYEYTGRMFGRNYPHRDRKPKSISKFSIKHGGDGKWWPLTPFPFLAPRPSRPPAIETPPRPVPAGPLISWPKNASCSRIPPQANRASLPPRRWATTRCRLSLRPCTAPLSCSLQPRLLKLSLLSLRPSLLQFVSIVSPLLIHGNLIFEPVFVFLSLSLLPLFFWWKRTSALSPCLQLGRYHHSDSTITLSLV